MDQEALRFRVENGMSYRLDSLGDWIPATDAAQPNPDYVHNPGTHGWVLTENGLARIDAGPGEEVVIPKLPRPEFISLDSFDLQPDLNDLRWTES